MESNLDFLSKDIAYLVLLRLKPHDVLNLCYSTTKQFKYYCTNQELFTNLMRVHYPNAVLTSNPREQYEAITIGYLTTYKFKYDVEHKVVIEQPQLFGETQLPQNTPGWSFNNVNINVLFQLYETDIIKNFLQKHNMDAIIISRSYQTIIVQTKYMRKFFNDLPTDITHKLIAKLSYEDLLDARPDTYRNDVKDDYVEYILDVKGNQIPHGMKLYTIIDLYNDAIFVGSYKTKEDAIESFLEQISELLDNKSSLSEDDHTSIIYYVNDVIIKPFNRETLYNYCLKHNSISVDDQDRYKAFDYHFIELEF